MSKLNEMATFIHQRDLAETLTKYRLVMLEIATLIVILALGVAFARPQLEGWRILNIFHLDGIQKGFQEILYSNIQRPLEPVPLMVAWIMGHGAGWATGFVFGIELLIKYLATRWAVSPLLRGANAWVVATLAALMLPWNGWLGHNMAQQLAAVFMLVALGASLRLRGRIHFGWLLLGSISILLSLFSYEALVLCAFAFPLVVLFSSRKPFRNSIVEIFRMVAPVILSLIFYVLFLIFTNSKDNYHTYLLSGPSPWKTLIDLFVTLYHTVYFSSAWTLLLMLTVLVSIMSPIIFTFPDRKTRIMSGITAVTAFVLLPLLSLPYSVNFYFLSDLGRVGFPVGFGFVLLCIAVLTRFSGYQQDKNQRFYFLQRLVIVLIVLIWGAGVAHRSYRPYELQRSILDQIKPLIVKNNARAIVVCDWTGRLGDMYTFLYPSTLEEALSVENVSVKVDLCTPIGVVRIHPVMKQVRAVSPVPWYSPEQMQLLQSGQMVLNVRNREADPFGLPIVTVVKDGKM
jgi:hypothetical protein